MRRAQIFVRLGAIGGAGGLATLVAAGATAPATEGCYTHQCDQSSVTIGLDADGGVVGTGEVFRNGNELTWESVPLVPAPVETWEVLRRDGSSEASSESVPQVPDQAWTSYPGNQTITFVYGPDAGIPSNATVEEVFAWVAAGDAAEENFTLAGGQLAEFSNVDTTSVTVLNSTCALYYLRVVVVFALSDAGVADGAGVEVGAGVDTTIP
jgi:hypothetical protein